MKKILRNILTVLLALTLSIGCFGLFACNKKVELFATCKVHYEPLGIYYGKATTGTAVTAGKTFEICNDTSNAIRAFQLLETKGVISKKVEGSNFPVKEGNEELNFVSDTWTSVSTGVSVKLISEELLVVSMADYDFACLPCNTAYTGKIDSSKRAAVEDDAEQVAGKANIIAARKNDYDNDASYKAKIDALTNAMLSTEVSEYFATKYLGAMTCDNSTQIDLRATATPTVNGKVDGVNTKIKVCASELPHADVLREVVKDLLSAQGYDLEITVLDWTLQNDSVANGDYDANYFQHVPYLNEYNK